MATTSIWPINGNISKVIRYVSNPDKTDLNALSSQDGQSLKDVMDYAVNPSKTEQQYLVSGVNCDPSIARQQMIITKQRYDKLDGRTAYHAYQSFKPGETDPQTAHQIGALFAQQLWGDRFQVVVATHVDKDHIHNHFVINSISFLDGKKFHSTCESYFGEMRTLSDKICEQHCLSVIRDPPKDGRSSRSRSEWQAEQEGKSTWRGLVKQDVDEAISQSAVWSQFLTGLKEKGYEVKSGVKHIAVRPPGKERFIRLRSLGDDYTEESIRKRLLNTSRDDQAVAEHDELSTVTTKSGPSSNQPSPLYQSRPGYKPFPSLHHIYARKRRKGFVPLYIRYLIQMGALRPRSSTRRTHFLLREDIRYLDRITAEFRLITDKRLDTYKDLLQYKQALSDQIIHLMSERKGLQLQMKREISEIPPPTLKEASKAITIQIRRNRRELALCEDIQQRSINMARKLNQVKQEKSIPPQFKKEEHAHDQRR